MNGNKPVLKQGKLSPAMVLPVKMTHNLLTDSEFTVFLKVEFHIASL